MENGQRFCVWEKVGADKGFIFSLALTNWQNIKVFCVGTIHGPLKTHYFGSTQRNKSLP